jgi:hypothetical protein
MPLILEMKPYPERQGGMFWVHSLSSLEAFRPTSPPSRQDLMLIV